MDTKEIQTANPQWLIEYAALVRNQIGKHGSYGGCETLQEAINSLSNWELLEIITEYSCHQLEVD